MAELSTLARPYARAAFEYAVEAGALENWSEVLNTLADVVEHPTVERLLSSPHYTIEQQAETLLDLCGEGLDDKSRNLVRLLAENRRLPLLPEISEQFHRLKVEREKTVDVELHVASEIDDSQRDKLVEALGKRLDRKVNVSVRIDKSLLGGVLVRAGDAVIDGTIRGRLNKLAEALNT
jgi:F-type H+-transporting ATPase subunit delta